MQRLYLVHSANEKFCEKKDMAITMTIITIAITTKEKMTRNEELVRGEKGCFSEKS